MLLRWLQLPFCCVLIVACAATGIRRQGADYEIAAPGESFVILFPSEGFKIEVADEARPYYYLTNDQSRLNVSFNFEPARACNTSASCRDMFAHRLKRLYPKRTNWRMSQIGDVYVSEGMDERFGDIDLRQHHMNAHFVRNGVWVDVHLSKVKYRESERRLFVDFVESIKLVARTDS